MPLDYDLTLEDQIRDCYGRVVYTHKTHERMADRCSNTLRFFKTAQIIISALTTAGAVSVVVWQESWIEVATAAVSFATLFVATYLRDVDPGALAQKHRDAAAKLWSIRECYFSLLTDLPNIRHEDAIERRDKLHSMLAAVYAGSPQTDGKAYREAQDRLNKNEDLTFSDDEIDCFLPQSLKRSGGRPKLAAES